MEKALLKPASEYVQFTKNDFDGLKVFVIDDEFSVREHFEYLLGSQGIKTYSYENDKDLSKNIKEIKPDLLIVDLFLKEKTGLEIIEELRSNPDFLEIPIIMLTGHPSLSKKADAFNSGADDFLEKPFYSYDIFFKIKSLIRRSNLKIAKKIIHKDFFICLESFQAKYQNNLLNLTKFQCVILASLIKKEGQIITSSNLLSQFNGKMKKRTLDVHMTFIRNELRKYNLDSIESILGVGYCFKI